MECKFDRTAPEWVTDCLRQRGKVLTGIFAHWCEDWDGLPVDETTPEEFECCRCYTPEQKANGTCDCHSEGGCQMNDPKTPEPPVTPSDKPYEKPTVILIGNINDLLAGTGSKDTDGTAVCASGVAVLTGCD